MTTATRNFSWPRTFGWPKRSMLESTGSRRPMPLPRRTRRLQRHHDRVHLSTSCGLGPQARLTVFTRGDRGTRGGTGGPARVEARRRGWRWHPLTAGARPRRVAVEVQHAGGLVASAAPRWPRWPRWRGQLGVGKPGGQHRVRVPHTAGVGSGGRCQSLWRSPGIQRGRHCGCEPGPLRLGEPPGIPQGGEELTSPAASQAGRGRRPARARDGGSVMVRWWIG